MMIEESIYIPPHYQTPPGLAYLSYTYELKGITPHIALYLVPQ